MHLRSPVIATPWECTLGKFLKMIPKPICLERKSMGQFPTKCSLRGSLGFLYFFVGSGFPWLPFWWGRTPKQGAPSRFSLNKLSVWIPKVRLNMKHIQQLCGPRNPWEAFGDLKTDPFWDTNILTGLRIQPVDCYSQKLVPRVFLESTILPPTNQVAMSPNSGPLREEIDLAGTSPQVPP